MSLLSVSTFLTHVPNPDLLSAARPCSPPRPFAIYEYVVNKTTRSVQENLHRKENHAQHKNSLAEGVARKVVPIFQGLGQDDALGERVRKPIQENDTRYVIRIMHENTRRKMFAGGVIGNSRQCLVG
jgi:hypothetical protein